MGRPLIVYGNRLTIPVGTDSVAAGVDLVQHQTGEGPGLDAITQGGTVYAEDLADDPRWVSFGPEAAKAAVRSALALRLSDDASRGAALILYTRHPWAFGALDRAKGVILAAITPNIVVAICGTLMDGYERLPALALLSVEPLS